MLMIGVILFSLAIFFGLILVSYIFKNHKTPKPVVVLHGTVALIAILSIVAYLIAGHTDALLITSLILFILGALGGVTMLMFDIKKENIPKMFLVVHPLIGISAFVILIIYMVQQAI